jgi:hypothetical protein
MVRARQNIALADNAEHRWQILRKHNQLNTMLGTLRDALGMLLIARSEAQGSNGVLVSKPELNTMTTGTSALHDDDRQSDASSASITQDPIV